MTKFMPDFSQQDYTVGDAFYNELSDIIVELERRKIGAVGRRLNENV